MVCVLLVFFFINPTSCNLVRSTIVKFYDILLINAVYVPGASICLKDKQNVQKIIL